MMFIKFSVSIGSIYGVLICKYLNLILSTKLRWSQYLGLMENTS